MKLYELHTEGLKSFFVLAEDPTASENKLIEILNKADYGLRGSRKIIQIDVIATEIKNDNLSSGDRLII